jgi:hypothetical protein
MRAFSMILLAAMLCIPVSAQNSAPQAYDDADVYAIYSLLLPGQQSYEFAKGTLVLQQETLASVKLDDSCLTPEAAREFKTAIEDYRRQNEPMLLQRRFNIEKPYEIVASETIDTLTKDHNWEEFYKRYPESGGVIMMSAVGFGHDRTLAVVYTWSTCNNLCGRGSFNLLKKVGRKWKTVAGVRCSAAA